MLDRLCLDTEPPKILRGESFFERMRIPMRIPGTSFSDDSPLPGSKSERIAKLEEALRFYANSESWEYRFTPTGEEVSNVSLDRGARARKALA